MPVQPETMTGTWPTACTEREEQNHSRQGNTLVVSILSSCRLVYSHLAP